MLGEVAMVECAECCGEGYDLDTYYEQDGLEEDCWACGGDGDVPDEAPGEAYEVQLTVTEHHVVTLHANSLAEAEELADDVYLYSNEAYNVDKKIVHVGKK